jgi:nucleotide-binding universal stress UspA family protein
MMPMPEISYLKLLVPISGPVPAKEKAEHILNLARKIHAEALVLHIVKEFSDKEKVDDGKEALKIFEDTGIKYDVKINTYLREGELLPTIIGFAEEMDVDLIVMGASEDGKMIAEWIVSDIRYKTDLPVVIEPHGFVTITQEM